MATKKELEEWQLEDARRLDELFKKHARLNQTDFGHQYEIGTQGMVWQYLSGRRPLNIKAAEAFSRGLGLSIDEFSPTIAQQIRNAFERTAPLDRQWPFPSIDMVKIDLLDDAQRAKLESALADSARELGLDIKKT